MQNVNSFSITAFVATAPVVNTFKSGTTVRRFAISVRRKENERTTSALINCECWRKVGNDASLSLIEKGKLLSLTGYFKPEEWESNGRVSNRVVLEVTGIEEYVAATTTPAAPVAEPQVEAKPKRTRSRKTA